MLVCKVVEVWQDFLSEYVDMKFTYICYKRLIEHEWIYYTQLYFTKKLVAHNNLKKKRKEKQQYKQNDNHLVTNVGSLQSRQLFVGIDCKQWAQFIARRAIFMQKFRFSFLAKITKRWYYSAAHWHLGDVLVGNITFFCDFCSFRCVTRR